MALKILKGRDGTARPTWYGRASVHGALRTVNLNVPIAGAIPTDADGNFLLTAKGDKDFERSRKAAAKAFEAWRKETRKDPAELAAKAYKARTGVSIEGVALSRLGDLWEKQKRTYTPTKNWAASVRTRFSRFAKFARKYAAKSGAVCETINDVTPEIAAAWFDSMKNEFTWETVRKNMTLLRSAYRRYAMSGKANPFEDIIMRNRETDNARISRVPLTAEQVERLFNVSRDDTRLYPLIVAAACTGMRLGDVCKLEWDSVNLKEGLITVNTGKTGARVTIPIFGRLRDVLDERGAISPGGANSPFVFPDAADQYERNKDWLIKTVKPYFALAVYGDGANEPEEVTDEADETRPIDEALNAANFTPQKRDRIGRVYELRKSGKQCAAIAAALGLAKGQVSDYLREAEELTGEKLRPMGTKHAESKARTDLLKKTRAKRGTGKRSASIYGWHSLRATFVVLAVEGGVPLPDVQKIVGHSTAEMTMQYFNPTAKHAAERVRQQMQESVLNGRRRIGATIEADVAAVAPVATNRPTIDDFISMLTPKQRKELAEKLLGKQ